MTGKTLVLLVCLAFLAVAVAWSAVGAGGAVLALTIGLAASAATYWGRARATMRLLGGRPLSWHEAPQLHALTAELARRAGLPAPAIYLLPGGQVNAVAVSTARGSAVGVTAPLLRQLDVPEVAAVIAHELAHIRHGDLLLAVVAGALAGVATFLAEMGRWSVIVGFLLGLPVRPAEVLMAVLVATGVPALALLLRMGLSREREWLADAGGAALIGSPELLARALWRLEQANRGPWWLRLFGWAPPAQPGGLARLFSSHPPTAERIERLMAMAPRRQVRFERLYPWWGTAWTLSYW